MPSDAPPDARVGGGEAAVAPPPDVLADLAKRVTALEAVVAQLVAAAHQPERRLRSRRW